MKNPKILTLLALASTSTVLGATTTKSVLDHLLEHTKVSIGEENFENLYQFYEEHLDLVENFQSFSSVNTRPGFIPTLAWREDNCDGYYTTTVTSKVFGDLETCSDHKVFLINGEWKHIAPPKNIIEQNTYREAEQVVNSIVFRQAPGPVQALAWNDPEAFKAFFLTSKSTKFSIKTSNSRTYSFSRIDDYGKERSYKFQKSYFTGEWEFKSKIDKQDILHQLSIFRHRNTGGTSKNTPSELSPTPRNEL